MYVFWSCISLSFFNLLFKDNPYKEVETQQVLALKHLINSSVWECTFFVQEKEVWVSAGQLLTLSCLVQASFNQYKHLHVLSLIATAHCAAPPCLSLRTAVSSTAPAQLRVKEFCAFKSQTNIVLAKDQENLVSQLHPWDLPPAPKSQHKLDQKQGGLPSRDSRATTQNLLDQMQKAHFLCQFSAKLPGVPLSMLPLHSYWQCTFYKGTP